MKYQSSHKLKYKLPLIASEKEKQVTTAAEDVKTSDESTQEMIRQIFNEVLKQEEDCTPETWSRIRLKVINVEEVGTHTADLHSNQHFTNCSQQPKRTDFTADSAKRNQNIREDLDVLTKRWTILQHTDCWKQKCWEWSIECGSRQCTSWRRLTRHVTSLYGERLTNAVSNHVTSASWRGYTRHRKGHPQRTEKSDVFELKEWTKGRFFVQFTLRHGAPNATGRWCGALAKIKRHGSTIGRLWIWLPHKHACCWRRVPVLYFAGAAPKSDVRLQAEYWECRIENPPGQDDNTEQPKGKQKKISGDQQH